MALDANVRPVLANAIGNDYIAKNLYDTINTTVSAAGVSSLGGVTGAITAAAGRTALGLGTAAVQPVATVVTAIAATTNILAVPGSFADAAAVQAYLADSTVIPNIETRLDNLESKVNAILTALKTGLMASS